MKHLKSYGVILGVIQEFLLGNKFGVFLGFFFVGADKTVCQAGGPGSTGVKKKHVN